MEGKPFVSIIVPVRNAERTIETTIQYLLNVSYPRDKMEIVFADGGSKDRTIEIINKWKIKYDFIKVVEVPDSKSPGHARNAALKVVKGDYILFTDGDCAPHSDWIDKMIEPFFKDEKIGLVGGEIYTLRTDANNDTEAYCEQVGFLTIGNRCGKKEGGYYPEIKKDLPSEVNGSQTCPFFATANLAASKKAVDSIGREFWHEITGEDVDFNLRILKNGFKLYFQPAAIVDHMHRATPAQFYKQLWGYGFGHPLLIKKHAKNVLEFYFQYFNGISIPIPFPVKGIIYIGDFMLFHISGLVFLISLIYFLIKGGLSAILANWLFLLITLLLTAFFKIRFFLPVLKMKPKLKIFKYGIIHYFSKWSFIKGGLDGMKKFGPIINIEG